MKLSIIIPTYNEQEYLPKLLESIELQNFNDYEVIVADAGSKDKTREIAHSHGCKIVDGGLPAKGRNNGANVARGEFLLFLDADAVLTDNYLKSAMEEFINNDLGIAITQMIPLSNRKIDHILHDFANFFMRKVESIKPHGAGCYGILTRKELHYKVDGFDEELDFGEDTDYIERVAKISSFKVLREPKLLVSTRRLEKEGTKNLAFKYIKSTVYQFAGKKITAEQLDYEFGHDTEQKRIFYGVCGEGMGHAIRSKVVIDNLKEKYDVTIFASDRAYDYLADKFDNVYLIEGFNTVYEDNRVNNLKTFTSNIKDLPSDLKDNIRLMYSMSKSLQPHIIISDFEFYTNLLSKLTRIPLLSLDNMHIITRTEIDVPNKYRSDRIRAQGVIKSFIIIPKQYFIITYFYPEIKNPEKVRLYPTILRDEIFKLKPKTGEHILVYQTSDSNKKLLKLIKEIDEDFIVYGFHIDKIEENLLFKKFNEKQFFEDLSQCKAVITNGGFTLISEALYLKKPILSIPIKKQFEQIVNAIYLDKLGYGKFLEEFEKEDIENFFKNLESYNENLKSYQHPGNDKLLNDLEKAIEEYAKKY
ncbi:MAG: MJ1255/VC2487 family glycosyltransferase [Methanomicrobiales archaeon]